MIKIHLPNQENSYQIEVRYKKDGENHEETISSESGRYAKYSFYTRMKYLEPQISFEAI